MSGRCLAVVSGKGGVGKTMIAAALGARYASGGDKVALLDLNMGMRGMDMALGLESRIAFDLGDVLDGLCGAERAMVTDRRTGVKLLAAQQITGSDRLDSAAFEQLVRTLLAQFDRVIIDAPPAVSRAFEAAARAADDLLLVSTPDDAALRGADRAAGMLARLEKPHPMLAINRIRRDHVEAGLQYEPEVCAQTLDLFLAGFVPEDDQATRCLLEKRPVTGDFPAAEAIANLARRMAAPDTALPRWRTEIAEAPEKKNGWLDRVLRRKAALRKEST